MSWLERAEAQLEQHSAALKIIEGIAHLVRDALVKPDTDTRVVLTSIEHAITTLIKGFDGKVTRDEVDKAIREMGLRRDERDAAKDAALDAKFDTGGHHE